MSMCYVARCARCGNVIAACVDSAKRKNQTAKDVRDWIKRGHTIERMDSEHVRVTLQGCDCDTQGDLFEAAGV